MDELQFCIKKWIFCTELKLCTGEFELCTVCLIVQWCEIVLDCAEKALHV